MPNKYTNKKGWKIPKQRYKVTNWSDYNDALRQRGNIEIWMASDLADYWYEQDRVYDGTGTPKEYTDLSIMICHEVRQVYKLPLRQCQGFIDSIFKIQNMSLRSPDYSCLSKRLAALHILSPRYKKADKADDKIAAIAIDSTGLRQFAHDEWQTEKHGLKRKKSWRKLHIAVDDQHIIHASELTDRSVSDDSMVTHLVAQTEHDVVHVTADGAYDKNKVYDTLSDAFQNADIIIPPKSNSVYDNDNHAQRNRNFQEIKTFGRMKWQKVRNYGKRNFSELVMYRYKKILGPALHAREMMRQKCEAILGCGILNRMSGLGMPISCRIA